MFELVNLAGVHTSSVKRKGLIHIFSRPKMRSPNVDASPGRQSRPPLHQPLGFFALPKRNKKLGGN